MSAWRGFRGIQRSELMPIVDDWTMASLAEAEQRSFLEICDERYLNRSTLLTSQLTVVK
jgi:hypothetical protein